MGSGIARERWHLLLDLLVPAVGASAAHLVLERAFLHDLRSEPLGGPPHCIGKALVVGLGPVHQEPACPPLPDQILRQSVAEHGP